MSALYDHGALGGTGGEDVMGLVLWGGGVEGWEEGKGRELWGVEGREII